MGAENSRVDQLEQQVADLVARVEALESAPAPADLEPRVKALEDEVYGEEEPPAPTPGWSRFERHPDATPHYVSSGQSINEVLENI